MARREHLYGRARRLFFSQEKATKWQENREIDGLTTNGVLIMHPRGQFCGGEAQCGFWREVSVGGGVFSLRESRSAQQKGNVVEDESNILQDGTLIDLCGATLLWRSAEGLAKSPVICASLSRKREKNRTSVLNRDREFMRISLLRFPSQTKQDLEELVDAINAGRPQCPVGLNTLVIPRKAATDSTQQQPYVYLKCGHVQGHHDWGQEKDKVTRRCPMCLVAGAVVKLSMGIEPAFYVDCGPPTYAFSPCGHMATEKTVKLVNNTRFVASIESLENFHYLRKYTSGSSYIRFSRFVIFFFILIRCSSFSVGRYWEKVAIPHGTNGYIAICPFCAVPLEGTPGYVKLIFQDNVD